MGAALATFKDLCIDAFDAERSGRFWAAALGLRFEALDDGDAVLRGPTDAHTVWINRVPETKTTKLRLHLDVHCSSIDELVGLGASVVDDSQRRWTVMRDPEGGEFCAFVRDVPPAYRLYELSVDCGDHVALSSWWHDLLGGELGRDDDRGWSWIEPVPDSPVEGIVFASVPEPKVGKNRVHIDLVGDADAIVATGATRLRTPDDAISWHVLADPEGNELCVFAPT